MYGILSYYDLSVFLYIFLLVFQVFLISRQLQHTNLYFLLQP